MGYDPVSYYKAKADEEAKARLATSLKQINESPCLSPLGPVIWAATPLGDLGRNLGAVYYEQTQL